MKEENANVLDVYVTIEEWNLAWNTKIQYCARLTEEMQIFKHLPNN